MRKTVLILLALPFLSHAVGKIEVVGVDSVDFGKYPACEPRSVIFLVRNTGDTPLQIIQVRKTCGCAAVTCSKTHLQVAETASIEVVILPDAISGRYRKNIFVESSDPANPFLRLNVSGEAIPLVTVHPDTSFYLDSIPTNTPVAKTFTLTPTDPAVRLGTPVVDGCDRIRAVLVPEEGPSNNISYTLDVMLMSSPETKKIHGSVSVPILNPTNRQPVKIGISGRIGDEEKL